MNFLSLLQHLQHVRILIAIYIRAAEYAKADTLIDNHGFGSDGMYQQVVIPSLL